MAGKKAVAAGHICLDLTPMFPDRRVNGIGDILAPGKLVRVGDVDIHTGGSVANTGLAMKILGADVKLMGKVGEDDFGDTVCRILRKYDADRSMIVSPETSTSYSVVLALPGVDRVFLHNPGANDSFSYEDVDWSAVEEASLFHFGYPPLMRRMYADQGGELVRMFRRAKDCGTVTSMDMAAIDASTDAGRADWNRILKNTLPYVDFFVPSVEELCFMLDRSRYEGWLDRAGGRDVTELIELAEIEALAEKALDHGARVVLIKCGAAGMYFRSSSEERMKDICAILNLPLTQWSGKSGFERSFVPEAVVSGTGAGDTSIAAFLTAALQGETLENAVQLAAATGACCVAAYDALGGLRSFAEIKEMIRAGWEKR